MKQYLGLLKRVLDEGVERTDRTGTGTKSIFGHQMRFDLAKGFPLLTTKKLHLRSITYELLWFLQGGTNIDYLKKHNVSIWDEWADKDGELGPIYGKQWRSWSISKIESKEDKQSGEDKQSEGDRESERDKRDRESERDKGDRESARDKESAARENFKGGRVRDKDSIDQIAALIHQIKTNPSSRRHIVTAWNPTDIDKMALPPCHCLFQFYVAEGRLSCQLYQRSADVFLGVPFNIASYALLTQMIAQVCDLELGAFVHTFGDAHLYLNHIQQAKEQLTRQPAALPHMRLNPNIKDIFAFRFEDFELQNYNPQPHIAAPIAV